MIPIIIIAIISSKGVRSANFSIRAMNGGYPVTSIVTESSRSGSTASLIRSDTYVKPTRPSFLSSSEASLTSASMVNVLKSSETTEFIYASLRIRASFNAAKSSGEVGTSSIICCTCMPSAVPLISFALLAAIDRRFVWTTLGVSLSFCVIRWTFESTLGWKTSPSFGVIPITATYLEPKTSSTFKVVDTKGWD